jgi:choline dehydrogenase
MGRANLTVETHCQVETILFDAAGRANGVAVRQNGVAGRFIAGKEVIVAAGAVGSPKLLQLSGIGDAALLQELGIPLRQHLPAVGQNLQDHLCVSFYYRANCKTLNDELGSLWGQGMAALRYAFTRKGPLALSVNQAGGFFRGSEEEERPNLQLYFNPLSYSIPKDARAALKPEPYSGFLLCFNPCRPSSRGSVAISSADPARPASIRPNYLSTDKDRHEAVQGSRFIRRLMQAEALRRITVEEVSPAGKVDDDDSMLRFFREESGSIYHLCGSCAMGPDPASAVVSHRLQVHGVAGLRVVDAAIFPNITSGNTNAPVMMVAEKAAEMILQDWH